MNWLRGTTFPENFTVTLKYHENISFNCTTGAVGTYTFFLNSGYDPNFTGTGHQPLGWDQWAVFYGAYVCTQAKWKLQVLNYSAYQAVVGTLLDNNTTPPTTLDALCEQPTAYHRFVLSQGTTYTQSIQFPEGQVNMGKFFGVKKISDEVQRFGSNSFGSSPSNGCYLHLFGRDISATGTVPVYVDVEIEQTFIFSSPNDIPAS